MTSYVKAGSCWLVHSEVRNVMMVCELFQFKFTEESVDTPSREESVSRTCRTSMMMTARLNCSALD